MSKWDIGEKVPSSFGVPRPIGQDLIIGRFVSQLRRFRTHVAWVGEDADLERLINRRL